MQRAQAGGAVVSTVRYLYKQLSATGGACTVRETATGQRLTGPIGRCESRKDMWKCTIKVVSGGCKIDSTLYGYPWMFMFAAGWPFLLDCHWIHLLVTAACWIWETRLWSIHVLSGWLE